MLRSTCAMCVFSSRGSNQEVTHPSMNSSSGTKPPWKRPTGRQRRRPASGEQCGITIAVGHFTARSKRLTLANNIFLIFDVRFLCAIASQHECTGVHDMRTPSANMWTQKYKSP